eukprot:TRINITY_DN1728_c0_g2_i1.p1 TRINITY_DN1728_c0_g2~~TRINITY_DN1728_c0_g2_i1.p1  ORF type:complete len:641 (-),score=114.12 TRINITY_DN1728_c0_g2_i1:124-2046(-)
MNQMKVYPMRCKVQTYKWGKKGSSSIVCNLLKGQGQQVDEEDNYAELWMGSHTNGPSYLTLNDKDEIELGDFISQNPHCLSPLPPKLPFLFKVLSIARPLSLQAHPDKKRAEALHKSFPNIYKDPNHKPELAIALTPMRALCGFSSFDQIVKRIQLVPELAQAAGEAKYTNFLEAKSPESRRAALKLLFTSLMTANKNHLSQLLDQLVERLTDKMEENLTPHESLCLEVATLYPSDVGLLGLFLLNYFTLLPGDAIFLAPNEPHAYLSGDCIECMAASDNVVRAGFTPKFVDVNTLCSMLSYSMKDVEVLKGEEILTLQKGIQRRLYKPPIPDFKVDTTLISSSSHSSSLSFTFEKADGPSIVLVTEGEGTLSQRNGDKLPLRPGSVCFVPSQTEFKVLPSISSPLRIVRAFCENTPTDERGAFIVFEGIDRSGKSTQVKHLGKYLKSLHIPSTQMQFPDRTTTIGKLIDAYLKSTSDIDDHTIHLLFSANRWELKDRILKNLAQGVTVICDRYAFSGVAFSSCKEKEGLDLEWCKNPDRGLPVPDLVLFLDLSVEEASKRGKYGEERYERKDMQTKVHQQFHKLRTPSWKVIDATLNMEDLGARVREASLAVIDEVKNEPLPGPLWTEEATSRSKAQSQ